MYKLGCLWYRRYHNQLHAFRGIEEQCGATDKVEMDRDEVDAKPKSDIMHPPQDPQVVKKMSYYIFETKKMPLLSSASRMRPAQCMQLIPNEAICSIVMHHCERLSRYLAKHQSKSQLFSNIWIAKLLIVTKSMTLVFISLIPS